jgi:hypothetical protein
LDDDFGDDDDEDTNADEVSNCDWEFGEVNDSNGEEGVGGGDGERPNLLLPLPDP